MLQFVLFQNQRTYAWGVRVLEADIDARASMPGCCVWVLGVFASHAQIMSWLLMGYMGNHDDTLMCLYGKRYIK